MGRTWKAALALASLCIAWPGHAQKMYRCGNTFSQQPCGDHQTEMALGTGRAATPTGYSAADAGALCSNAIRSSANPGGDAGLFRIEGVAQGQADVYTLANGVRAEGRAWFVTATKALRGGLPLTERYTCILSLDGRRLLRVAGPGERYP